MAKNPWVAYAARRLVSLVVVLALLVIVSFLLVRLVPGDPAVNIAGVGGSQESIVRIRHELGIDRPLLSQFGTYVSGLVHGDLGKTFVTQQPVWEVIKQRIGPSVQLAGASLVLVLVVGVTAGIVAGALTREGRHRRAETGFTALTSLAGAVPDFLAATFLALVFAVLLHWLPVAGSVGVKALILPTLAVSLAPIAVLSRVVRVETLNVLATDYMRTARSKRLPARLIYGRHVLPNALTAALTIGGVLFAGLIGSAVIVDNVFARAGLGTALVQAVLARDYLLVQGIILALGVVVVVVNMIVDIVLAIVDPRSMAREA